MKPFIIFLLIPFVACTQPSPPCGLDYGTTTDRENIQLAMFSGTVQDVTNAINNAKNTRGTAVGCPQLNYGPYLSPDTSLVSLASIEQVWNTLYKPYIEAYQIGCPEIGRAMPRYGLAALYARQAGYYNDLPSLARIGQMLEAQQYSLKHAASPLVTAPGVYGYYNGPNGNSCQLGGVAGTAVAGFCPLVPSYCVTYNSGLYSSNNFAVNDHFINGSTIIGDLGGIGYDQGWATIFMIENAIQQQDTALVNLFTESAILSGEWSIQHPLTTNHNYTAKLVWLLAQLYAWTGRTDFKNALIDRLDRNIIPGVLTDWNNDGFVDGMTQNIRFDSLVPAAQIPGRNWDGHNSLPWYQSMNAWAVLEAYVAFRDRGDTALANYYKPYALLMIDNLAWEYTELGAIQPSSTGWADTPHAILLAIWKVAQYENEAHPKWLQAAWALWNTGVFSIQGDRGVNVPLYLLIKTQTPYVPLSTRSTSVSTNNQIQSYKASLKIFPNPANDILHIDLKNLEINTYKIEIYNQIGQLVFEENGIANAQSTSIDISRLPKGFYTLRLSNNIVYYSSRFVK